MYRTDKQFMKNPATAGARIYVGNLPKTVVANDLEEIFKQHGNVVGLSVNLGFAFIQYEHDQEAQTAIQKENGTIICGKKIMVKQALDKTKPLNPNQNTGPRPPIQRGGPPAPPQKQGPPPPSLPVQDTSKPSNPPSQQPPHGLPGIKNLPEPKFSKPDKEDFNDEIIEDGRPNIRPPGPPQHDDRGPKGGRMGGRGGGRGRPNDHERFTGRFEPPPKMDMYRDRDPYFGRDNRDFGPPQREPFMPPPIIEPIPAPEKNDCEIIVVSKALTEYAEFIEQKLKKLGLMVDLLFPNEDVPIGKVLANISSRGCLYAILVMPINEEHRSLTLNVLHGLTQEHRNMPVDDAMIFISRNFESYMKGEHTPSDQTGQMTLLDRHPVQIQMLLSMLVENRQISTPQYDRLMKYLQERRELQQEYEIAEGITPEDESDSKKAELQNRIMNILNKSADVPIPTSITAPDPVPTSEPTPILKDPTVQKALDSLMLGDMFKNMAG
ncbi:unnamed protein product [Phaedon cochleariae]|uniref:RRM domain-containing protein n=1 Tax=Phaedon cochleariae TaxID=80249 RepID=A0A9P0DN32_PHACE|nr:unnamed protein product [Phaedon cochleariae]